MSSIIDVKNSVLIEILVMSRNWNFICLASKNPQKIQKKECVKTTLHDHE
jgi:hypothetical protein